MPPTPGTHGLPPVPCPNPQAHLAAMCHCNCEPYAAQALGVLSRSVCGRQPASLRQPNGCNGLKSGGIVPPHKAAATPPGGAPTAGDLQSSLSSWNLGAQELLEFRGPGEFKSFWSSRSWGNSRARGAQGAQGAGGARELLKKRAGPSGRELENSMPLEPREGSRGPGARGRRPVGPGGRGPPPGAPPPGRLADLRPDVPHQRRLRRLGPGAAHDPMELPVVAAGRPPENMTCA